MTGAARAATPPPRLRALTVVVPLTATAALAVAMFVERPTPGAFDVVAALLGAAVLAADVRPVRIGPRQKTTLATVPAVAAALVLPPVEAAIGVGLAAVAANAALRRPPRNAAYNASAVVLGVLAAAGVGHLRGRDGGEGVALAVAAAAAFSLVTTLCAAAAAAFQTRQPVARVTLRSLADTWPQLAAMDCVAVASTILYRVTPVAALLPLALLPLVYGLNRTLEAEIEARSQLTRLLTSQRRFLTDVSHNIGNPLATIRTNLSVLGRARLTAVERVAATDAVAEAERLSDLFRRLRVLAETDEEIPLERAPVDLAEIARDLVRAYAVSAASHGVAIEEELRPARVEADEGLLRQAAANLVENAIRHTPSGRRVIVLAGVDAREARLEVIDEGAGIEPDRLPVIFERFRSGPGGGSGLGLAIARSVVERHGGRIEVESQVGTGSRFRIRLPVV